MNPAEREPLNAQRGDRAVCVGTGEFAYEALVGWERLPDGWSLVEVVGVASDSRGRLYVFNRGEHPLVVLNRDGTFVESWGEGAFTRPHGITIGPDDAVYLTDDLDHTVRKYTPEGKLCWMLGRSGRKSDTGAIGHDYRTIQRAGPPFNLPTNVALSPEGDLYVADGYGNARVHKFSANGNLLLSWGRPGRAPGEFHIPHGIAVDKEGTVYVADRENNRIQRFSPDGEFRGEWLDLARPCEVCVDPNGVFYVAELGFRAGMWPGESAPEPNATGGRVSVLDGTGRLLARWGGGKTPCAPGDFFAPHDIWVDAWGDLYVAEVTLSAGGNRGLVAPTCHTLQKFVLREKKASRR